jgi:hypothetical protein
MTKAKLKAKHRPERPEEREMIEELSRWASTKERAAFVRELNEYFDLTSLILIVRAASKTKVCDLALLPTLELARDAQ